jgi:hypothetical protein
LFDDLWYIWRPDNFIFLNKFVHVSWWYHILYGQMTFSDNCMIKIVRSSNISKIIKQSYFVICLNYYKTSFKNKNVNCPNYSTTPLKHKNVRCLVIYLETWHFYLFKWWCMINLDIKSVWIDMPTKNVIMYILFIFIFICVSFLNYYKTPFNLKNKNGRRQKEKCQLSNINNKTWFIKEVLLCVLFWQLTFLF